MRGDRCVGVGTVAFLTQCWTGVFKTLWCKPPTLQMEKVGSERRSPLPRVPQLPPTPGAALAAAQEATGSLLLSSPMFPQVFPFPSEL